jgi:hypothetical protein
MRQRMKTYGASRLPWPTKTPEDRWHSFVRYYAMGPAPFETRAINTFAQPGDILMDPFSDLANDD